MLCIKYLNKPLFMAQVAASRGSVYLHLDDGSVCDLKDDSAASEIFRMMDAPSDGIRISVSEPEDVSGFIIYMLEAARPARAAH